MTGEQFHADRTGHVNYFDFILNRRRYSVIRVDRQIARQLRLSSHQFPLLGCTINRPFPGEQFTCTLVH